jgi:CubicO group peptidase (beta-lactamase class C family)
MTVRAASQFAGTRPMVLDRRGSVPGPPVLGRVQNLLDTWIAQRAIAGAQISVRFGDSAVDLCAGLARPDQEVTPGTLVPWFSAGKVVTSLVILRLAEERRLSLDEPVAAWIPEFRRPVHGLITLRHLLTHTSGLRDRGSLPFRPVAEVIRAAAEPGGRYTWLPGTHCAYSRYVEWYVLSAVVERVIGEPIQQVLNGVLREIGTERSAFGLTEAAYAELAGEIAFIYSAAEKGSYQRLHAMRQEACRCDRVGNGLGPMRDLATIARALLPGPNGPGGFLRDESKELARSGQARGTDQHFGVPLSYGLGVMADVRWRFGEAWDATSFGHVGSSVVGTLADPSVNLAAAFFVNGKIRSRSLNDSTPRFMAIGRELAEDLGIRS